MLTFLDGLAGALILTAAISDIRSYRIPNWISVALVALVGVRMLTAPVDVVASVTIGALVLAAGFVLFATKLFGAGDAKLLAALSLWAGPSLILEFLTATALAGGVVATAILFFRKTSATPMAVSMPQGSGTASDLGDPTIDGKRVSSPMPYGVAIAAGGLWCVVRHHIGS